MIEKSTSTTKYPSPEMILAGEVSPGRCNKAAERARADENAVQVNQGRRAGTGMVCGREQRKEEEVYIVPTKFLQKRKPLNCCSSSAARRVSENADAICE